MNMRHCPSATIAAVLLAASSGAILPGQTEQGSALLCGELSTVGPPANIRVASNASDGVSYVRFDVQGTTRTLTLRGVEQVRSICPVPGRKIVIFGALTDGASDAYELALANSEDGTLMDSWDAYTPVMSPDQRWVVLRKFYPPQTALTVSEEYLLYPLWRIETAERAPQDQNAEPPSMAIVVYPLGQTNTFMSNIGVSADQAHVFRSRSFFWSEDSRAVLFADGIRGSLSAVLVEPNHGKSARALVYPLSAEDVCGSPNSGTSAATLAEASVGSEQNGGTREIKMKFESSSAACKPKTLVVRTSDFREPKPELHPVRKRTPSTPARQ